MKKPRGIGAVRGCVGGATTPSGTRGALPQGVVFAVSVSCGPARGSRLTLLLPGCRSSPPSSGAALSPAGFPLVHLPRPSSSPAGRPRSIRHPPAAAVPDERSASVVLVPWERRYRQTHVLRRERYDPASPDPSQIAPGSSPRSPDRSQIVPNPARMSHARGGNRPRPHDPLRCGWCAAGVPGEGMGWTGEDSRGVGMNWERCGSGSYGSVACLHDLAGHARALAT